MKQRERKRKKTPLIVDTLFRDSTRKLPGPIYFIGENDIFLSTRGVYSAVPYTKRVKTYSCALGVDSMKYHVSNPQRLNSLIPKRACVQII